MKAQTDVFALEGREVAAAVEVDGAGQLVAAERFDVVDGESRMGFDGLRRGVDGLDDFDLDPAVGRGAVVEQ